MAKDLTKEILEVEQVLMDADLLDDEEIRQEAYDHYWDLVLRHLDESVLE